MESLLEAGELGTWTLVADTLRNGQPCEHHCRPLPLWPISLRMCFFVCLFCFFVAWAPGPHTYPNQLGGSSLSANANQQGTRQGTSASFNQQLLADTHCQTLG